MIEVLDLCTDPMVQTILNECIQNLPINLSAIQAQAEVSKIENLKGERNIDR